MKAISIKNGSQQRIIPGVETERLMELSRETGTPFMLLRPATVQASLDRLREALPGVDVFYAVKANDHSAILRTLFAAGASFDVSSAKELEAVLAIGGRAQDVIHTNPIKSPAEFDRAVELGVRLFVADNLDELDKFARYQGRAKLLIRFKTAEGGSVVNLSYKFGTEPAAVPALLDRVVELGLPFRGFSFHVGSQCIDTTKYAEAIRTAGELLTQARARGLRPDLLDIGGGFPIRYTRDVPDIAVIGRAIMPVLRESIDPSIRVICEPGRFICGEAATLFVSVIGRAVRNDIKWYYLDDGLYGSFSGCLFDHCRYQFVTSRNTKWEKAVLAGPTCDSFDVIYSRCLVPPLEVGDVLIFPGMGAYTSVSATTFNGLAKAKTVVVDW